MQKIIIKKKKMMKKLYNTFGSEELEKIAASMIDQDENKHIIFYQVGLCNLHEFHYFRIQSKIYWCDR